MNETDSAMNDREAYVPPDVSRIGTVEELTEGTLFTDELGDVASFGV